MEVEVATTSGPERPSRPVDSDRLTGQRYQLLRLFFVSGESAKIRGVSAFCPDTVHPHK